MENDEIDLVIFDGRTIPQKVKEKCETVEITNAITTCIKTAYPAAKINILSNSDYYKDARKNIITIKLAISAYHAGFGTDITVGIGSVGGNFSYGIIPKGEWNAVTGYFLKIYDFRNGKEEKYTKEINKIASKPNMWGYKSAKSCLNKTYAEANQDLLFFIDESLMK